MSVELKTAANIKYINIKMKKKLKNNSEIIYIIKDAGELCVKILLFLLCCENLDKIDFEFMKSSVRTQTADDDELIEALEFWKEKNILDYEITSSSSAKGANMDNIINIILNISRDINILRKSESEGYGEFDEEFGICGERYIKNRKLMHEFKPDDIYETEISTDGSGESDEMEAKSETEIEIEEETEIGVEVEAEETEISEDKSVSETQEQHIYFNSQPVSYAEIIESLETKDEFRRLTQEAQNKMQTMFNFSDLSIMYNIYEANKMEVDLILTLADICVEEGKNNIRYLEKIALGMAANGILKLSQYEDKIKEIHKIAEFEDKLKKLFKINNRKFTSKEKSYIKKWAKEFDFPDDVLSEGYKKCMKYTEKLSLDYINKIYISWQEKGFRTLEDINNEFGANSNPEVMNNIPVNRKNAGVNVDQFFEKAVRKGVKF